MDTDEATAAIAALAHHVRLDVWRLLLPRRSLGLSAGTIAARLAIAPSSLSFHLHQMTYARVLRQRRFSRQVIYAINEEIVEKLFGFLTGEDMSRPILAALSLRKAGEVVGNGQDERTSFSVDDNLVPAARL